MANRGDLFEPGSSVVVRSPLDEALTIATVDEWFLHAPPMGGARHWRDGRSAKEVAKTWCQATGIAAPEDLINLIRTHPLTAQFEPANAIPECPTDLGGETGGRRKHDLVVFGKAGTRRILVGVEAKADESFDEPLDERVAKARRLLVKGTPTGQLDRIQRLSRATFGRPAINDANEFDDELRLIPYQLLAGIAGTVIEAGHRHADVAVFVVHAFHTERLDARAVSENIAAFKRFVVALAHEPVPVTEGQLLGPFAVPGGEGVPARDVLIGMTTSHL